ncbi:hypothetical protein DIPPA_26515 [Diplonema papillatum]|nr:hypothetical protein DIPPA_26515 [Diplonema papillatum]
MRPTPPREGRPSHRARAPADRLSTDYDVLCLIPAEAAGRRAVELEWKRAQEKCSRQRFFEGFAAQSAAAPCHTAVDPRSQAARTCVFRSRLAELAILEAEEWLAWHAVGSAFAADLLLAHEARRRRALASREVVAFSELLRHPYVVRAVPLLRMLQRRNAGGPSRIATGLRRRLATARVICLVRLAEPMARSVLAADAFSEASLLRYELSWIAKFLLLGTIVMQAMQCTEEIARAAVDVSCEHAWQRTAWCFAEGLQRQRIQAAATVSLHRELSVKKCIGDYVSGAIRIAQRSRRATAKIAGYEACSRYVTMHIIEAERDCRTVITTFQQQQVSDMSKRHHICRQVVHQRVCILPRDAQNMRDATVRSYDQATTQLWELASRARIELERQLIMADCFLAFSVVLLSVNVAFVEQRARLQLELEKPPSSAAAMLSSYLRVLSECVVRESFGWRNSLFSEQRAAFNNIAERARREVIRLNEIHGRRALLKRATVLLSRYQQFQQHRHRLEILHESEGRERISVAEQDERLETAVALRRMLIGGILVEVCSCEGAERERLQEQRVVFLAAFRAHFDRGTLRLRNEALLHITEATARGVVAEEQQQGRTVIWDANVSQWLLQASLACDRMEANGRNEVTTGAQQERRAIAVLARESWMDLEHVFTMRLQRWCKRLRAVEDFRSRRATRDMLVECTERAQVLRYAAVLIQSVWRSIWDRQMLDTTFRAELA